jgi:hypothetical protein
LALPTGRPHVSQFESAGVCLKFAIRVGAVDDAEGFRGDFNNSGSDAGGSRALTNEIFSDYRTVDSVLFLMKQIMKIKPKSGDWSVLLTLTFTSVAFNDLDRWVFAPPQSVRDLAAKGKATPYARRRMG